MTITVGERPDNDSPFNGTTDIAFGPNGHLYITDGYGNARVLEYTPDGKRVEAVGQARHGSRRVQPATCDPDRRERNTCMMVNPRSNRLFFRFAPITPFWRADGARLAVGAIGERLIVRWDACER
jgi:NHL repeat